MFGYHCIISLPFSVNEVFCKLLRTIKATISGDWSRVILACFVLDVICTAVTTSKLRQIENLVLSFLFHNQMGKRSSDQEFLEGKDKPLRSKDGTQLKGLSDPICIYMRAMPSIRKLSDNASLEALGRGSASRISGLYLFR